jgi:flavin-dependent dehydrogenase
MKTVTITGGGLAGLSLGIALRRRGVPVTVHEAGTYPRHRVCGEFITGISEGALKDLGIADILADALSLESLSWYSGDERVLKKVLPRHAWGISRWRLDKALADRFEELGGELRTSDRVTGEFSKTEGIVRATGRAPASGSGRLRWIGLKVHLSGLDQEDDLELHMGRRGYAGLSRIEDGKFNLCGLFRQVRGASGKGTDLLCQYLKMNGLRPLMRRVERADRHEESFCAVVGMDYGLLTPPQRGFVLGDNWALIPPFTGNGMSLAFESALIAAAPLTRWARDECDWQTAERAYRRQLAGRLRGRIVRARLLHGCLLLPLSRKILTVLARTDSLPFRALYALTH